MVVASFVICNINNARAKILEPHPDLGILTRTMGEYV